MPINEFVCLKCQTRFDFIKITSDDTVMCPQCGMDEEKYLEKQIPRQTTHQLKGTGWYKDGYGKTSK